MDANKISHIIKLNIALQGVHIFHFEEHFEEVLSMVNSKNKNSRILHLLQKCSLDSSVSIAQSKPGRTLLPVVCKLLKKLGVTNTLKK